MKKLLCFWLIMMMLLTQVPFACATSIEEMSTKVTVREQELQEANSGTHVISKEFRGNDTDYSQYLTDEILKPEELALDGIPFYELSIEESLSHLSAFSGMKPVSEIQHLLEDPGLWYSASNDQRVFIDFYQENNSATLNDVSIYASESAGYGFETYVRGIKIGDSIEDVLRKIGVASNGVSMIAGILNGQNGAEFAIVCEGNGERTASITYTGNAKDSTIFWVKDESADGSFIDDPFVNMVFNENHLRSFQMGGRKQNNSNNATVKSEYIYDVPDPGEVTKLPTDLLDKVTDSKSAADAVKQMTDGMTSEQKTSPTSIDLATLYAETATLKAASKDVEGGEVIISASSVADVEAAAKQAAFAVETALVNGGVATARYLAKTVSLITDETGEITIKIDPDILTAEVDKIRVETPGYALTLKTADLAEDLTEVLTITAEEVGSGFVPGKANRKVTVKVTLPKGRTTNPVTISLPADKGATTYQAVVRTDGSATSSKYNPATTTMDGKVNTSGTYTVQTNEKSFTDISNKSAETQKAILYLTSKGIINGTSATTFSPNGTINRQQVAALLMRALGKVDNSAVASFKDVSAQSSLYHEIASSKKHKIVNGYSDNTFRGTNVISRAQIITVAGRVLSSEMNYKAPSNTSTYLSKYSDTVPNFAKEMVALATRENLVVYRTDGTFSGGKNMTRGDAAIILYRLFQRIW